MNALVSTNDPNISTEIDALIDTFEECGGAWHVIGGSAVVDPYLAFELPKLGKLSVNALRAMEDFQYEFDANVEVRRAVIEHAISIGGYYVELGNPNPVVSEGRTVQ